MNIFRSICGVYAMLVVLFSSLVINVAQIVATVSLYAFTSEKTRLAVNQWLANLWWDLWAFVFEVWLGLRYVITGDAFRSENAILSGNHTGTLDFVNGIVVTSKVAGLGCGKMITFLKQAIAFYPTVGWISYFQGCKFLQRNWKKDEARVRQTLSDLNGGKVPEPFWVGIYPEGTRITPKKREASHKFAKEKGLPILNNCLLPRAKGITVVRQSLKQSLKSIYHVTAAYENGPIPSLMHVLTGKSEAAATHLHVQRIEMKDVPEDAEELKQWLMDLFVETDKRLEKFQKAQQFAEHETPLPDQTFRLRLLFLLWTCFFAVGSHFVLGRPIAALSILGLGGLTLFQSFRLPSGSRKKTA